MAELQKPPFQEENSSQAALPVRGGVGKGVPGRPGTAAVRRPPRQRVWCAGREAEPGPRQPGRELLPSGRPASGRSSLCFTGVLPPRPLDFLFSRGM